MTNSIFKPFDSADWMAFAGTEGKDPLIAYFLMAYEDIVAECTVIIDDTGIAIWLDEEANNASYALYTSYGKAVAENIRWIEGKFSAEVFRTLGFERIG